MRAIKNIPYYSKEAWEKVFRFFQTTNPNTQIELMSMIMQRGFAQAGTQFVVDQEVSAELEQTDMNHTVSFKDIPWPSSFMEFYFQDPTLPTFIAAITSCRELREKYGFDVRQNPKSPYDDDDVTFRLICWMDMDEPTIFAGVPVPEIYYISYKFDEMDSFCREETDGWITKGATPLGDDGVYLMRRAAKLICKSLIYASIPRFAPEKLPINPTRAMLPYGGKAGIKERPKRPAFRLVYLPQVVRETIEHQSTGITREFKGRRGHFHWYKSDKFVNRKGTFDYFPPIAGPDGKVPTIYRVRKPEGKFSKHS